MKKKDRERDCSKDMVGCLDLLPLQIGMDAWCQLPAPATEKRDIVPDDLERLTKAIRTKCPKATVEVPEPTTFVLVSAMPFGPHERSHGVDSELMLLEKFDPGFAELFREARRVQGLVRKQWYQAIVWVKPEPGKEEQRPFSIGIGFATDRNLARARAVYSAEIRVSFLTEAMLAKNVPEKPIPKSPIDDAPKAVEP
jgi:hypothetical protein